MLYIYYVDIMSILYLYEKCIIIMYYYIICILYLYEKSDNFYFIF